MSGEVAGVSPRRSLSDVDCDDELAELYGHGRSKDMMESDEDTEDASESGSHQQEEFTEIKEQAYYEKLNILKALLKQLEEGTHPEYIKKLQKIDKACKERKKLNDAWRNYETECIDRDYLNEKKAALREFEDKKIELRENIVTEHDDKRKTVDSERQVVELVNDTTEVKTISTRKLRRRPNEPAPLPEKRRKAPQSQIVFLLDDRDIDDDLRIITKGKLPAHMKKQDRYDRLSGVHDMDTQQASDIRIEDGKLFYEKKWFHRGQPVYVEGKDLPRTSGVVSAISHDTVWVRKLGDQAKFRVSLTHIMQGKYSIKRRA